jgi:2-oxoglutarate dehydrogenase E1 component
MEIADPIEQNGWLVEEKYQQFLVNPASVDESWRALFSNGWDRRRSASRDAPTDLAEYGTPARAAAPAAVLLDAPPSVASLAPADSPQRGAAVTTDAATKVAAPTDTRTIDSDAKGAGTDGAAGISSPSGSTAPKAPSSDAVHATPLRGAPAKLAEHMTTSLGVPTATSVHPLPAAVLEANRGLINAHRAASGAPKISFTHLIAFAIVRALRTVPVLNSTYVADIGTGGPGVIHHEHLGLGLAIDIEKRDGSHSLLVPVIRDADTLDFVGLVDAYDDIVRRAREGKLGPEAFAGATVSITNPGGLGTTQSVPRLMAGQGAIIGVGAIDYPVEFAATDPGVLSSLGIGKVVTLTSTYDHRIIQGAESGLFLKIVHELLIGEHGFYAEVFDSLGVAARPVQLGRDTAPTDVRAGVVDARVMSLVDAYRTRGHLAAWIDPLGERPPELPADLDPVAHGFSVFDLERTFELGGVFGAPRLTLAQLLDRLRTTYCGTVGVEFRHIQELAERTFFERTLEVPTVERTPDQQRRTLALLERAEAFEQFLQVRYPALRRFSLEGGETAIAFLDALFERASAEGATDAIVGMAHRGRLNALANIIGKPTSAIFAEFEDNLDPLTVEGNGDVKYHKGGHGTWTGSSGQTLDATLVANPSHLEAVDPVVEGMARARQDMIGDGGSKSVLPLLVHGDASIAGQGVVAETFNLSLIPANRTGGTVHLVINNQIGFTTDWRAGRSTRYATDVAKMVEAPILHVNADDPDAVVRCAEIAVAYRTAFGKDVVVDLVCYRVHGHNEGDDPTYTQPVIYRAIADHPSVRTLYAERLAVRGVCTTEEATDSFKAVTAELVAALAVTRETPHPELEALPEQLHRPMPSLSGSSGVDRSRLDALVGFIHRAPESFRVHPKLERQFNQRLEQYEEAGEVDWAHGEVLAYATLLVEGVPLRIIGQDARRGTFSHRHATLADYDTGDEYTALTVLAQGGVPGLEPAAPTRFEIWDSALTEYAGLGFEYGYTLGNPRPVVIWEAQFGDFANGAQIIVDNFIASAEEKWGQRSGIVMLLPHGYEGQGPEHSSARIERYLQLSSGENLSVVQPTTASQFFHLIRAQAHLDERRPLIVITPKSTIRKRIARSKVDELVSGTFRTVIDDPPAAPRDAVRRVVLGSGRIIEDLIERRTRVEQGGGPPIGIVRVEQLTPWPTPDVTAVLARYPRVEEVVWAQDEPENMGALTFAVARLPMSVGSAAQIYAVSRRRAGSPATGSHLLHPLELESILERAIGPVPS